MIAHLLQNRAVILEVKQRLIVLRARFLNQIQPTESQATIQTVRARFSPLILNFYPFLLIRIGTNDAQRSAVINTLQQMFNSVHLRFVLPSLLPSFLFLLPSKSISHFPSTPIACFPYIILPSCFLLSKTLSHLDPSTPFAFSLFLSYSISLSVSLSCTTIAVHRV